MSQEAGACAGFQGEAMESLRATHSDWTDDIFDSHGTRFGGILRELLGRSKQRHLKSTVRMF